MGRNKKQKTHTHFSSANISYIKLEALKDNVQILKTRNKSNNITLLSLVEDTQSRLAGRRLIGIKVASEEDAYDIISNIRNQNFKLYDYSNNIHFIYDGTTINEIQSITISDQIKKGLISLDQHDSIKSFNKNKVKNAVNGAIKNKQPYKTYNANTKKRTNKSNKAKTNCYVTLKDDSSAFLYNNKYYRIIEQPSSPLKYDILTDKNSHVFCVTDGCDCVKDIISYGIENSSLADNFKERIDQLDYLSVLLSEKLPKYTLSDFYESLYKYREYDRIKPFYNQIEGDYDFDKWCELVKNQDLIFYILNPHFLNNTSITTTESDSAIIETNTSTSHTPNRIAPSCYVRFNTIYSLNDESILYSDSDYPSKYLHFAKKFAYHPITTELTNYIDWFDVNINWKKETIDIHLHKDDKTNEYRFKIKIDNFNDSVFSIIYTDTDMCKIIFRIIYEVGYRLSNADNKRQNNIYKTHNTNDVVNSPLQKNEYDVIMPAKEVSIAKTWPLFDDVKNVDYSEVCARKGNNKNIHIHVRKAHFHTYWYGKRGQQKSRIKWNTATIVNESHAKYLRIFL